MTQMTRKYPYQTKVERFSHLYTDPISRNILRAYQNYIIEEPYSKQGVELDSILNFYVTNASFFAFVQKEYYNDELPYFLEFTEEMRRLRKAYQVAIQKKEILV